MAAQRRGPRALGALLLLAALAAAWFAAPGFVQPPQVPRATGPAGQAAAVAGL
eukprot:CAMPEP_0168483984 /NCGR_PEP_ID=MMETSP0228-20121227/65857_1 /TAXON_ID=133427 /ORGANISM="Protoceratium reticulatum, Strain CCCM 535 (=CCMP 1889)" /LENGTH=52 /DNA_ID=CAMNT_0008500497 /DNA_START=18 /DNA_END=172 /DNA_ORIENTATION=+